MCEFIKAIEKHGGRQSAALLKHLKASGITEWGDLTKSNLFDFRDHLTDVCAASSSKTYMATLKGILARYEDEETFCKEYRDILKVKAEKPVKTYLNRKELNLMEGLDGDTLSKVERLVRARFMIGAYTGMRVSDAMEVTPENISEGMLTYVSKKTGIEATIPCSDKAAGYIRYAQENDTDISLVAYNEAIRRICKKAGIHEKVKVYKGEETKMGEKWQFVSSHTARISFATNLSELGVPLVQLSRMMGHSSVSMTERYIVSHKVHLSEKAMGYFI